MRNKETKSDGEINFERILIDGVEPEEDSIVYDYLALTSYNNNQSCDLSKTYFDSQAKRDLIGQSKKDEENRKKIFEVIYPEKIPAFTYIEDKSTNESLDSEISILKRKRYKFRRRRRENADNIRKKIKTRFINGYLIKKINLIAKSNGSYFAKFPQEFISKISKKENKKLLNMTLIEIFETEKLYPLDDLHFKHNFKVLEKKEIKENEKLMEILNKKYCELFKDYINTTEFKVDEINRLKNIYNILYVKDYKYLAEHFIEFYVN